MRFQITIDVEPEPASNPRFVLTVAGTDPEGREKTEPYTLGGESRLVGEEIPEMLHELMSLWSDKEVVDLEFVPLPVDIADARTYDQLKKNPCDECDERPATQFWPKLATPVQLCEPCTHNARRSGWEPGR